MESLFDKSDNAAIILRIHSLNSDSKPLWGKMNVAQMLSHCQAPLDVATGDLQLKSNFILQFIGKIYKKKMVQKKAYKPQLQARQTLPAEQTAAASLAFPMLPSLGVGTLDSYIAYVNRVPMLSAAEELHLAQEFRRTENVDAAKTLVLSHLRLSSTSLRLVEQWNNMG